MKSITELLAPLNTLFGKRLNGIFHQVVFSSLSFTGMFSLTNLSRWTIGAKGSLRSIERFFSKPIDWAEVNFTILRDFLDKNTKVIIAFDETVGKKAGKSTYGVGKHFDNKSKKVIPSVAILMLSLIIVQTKTSYSLCFKQLLFPKKKKVNKPKEARKTDKKRSVGRPKGSKNKKKAEPAYTFTVLNQLLTTFVSKSLRLLSFLRVKYAVGDGGFANKTVALFCKNAGLELISKLNYNSALYFKSTEAHKTKPKKYGEKLDFNALNDDFLETEKIENGYRTKIYNFPELWSRNFPTLLNVVVIWKECLADKKTSWVVLFSTSKQIDFQNIITYYRTRFQIEFDFRDARQFFGLTNFKNIRENQVTNVIGNAFCMSVLSKILIQKLKKEEGLPIESFLDLKAYYRASKYIFEIKNMLEKKPTEYLLKGYLNDMALIGAINT